MDKIWRLLVAIFILLAALVLMLVAFIFENTVAAGICIYGVLICIPWGLIKGINVIIDYHRENKAQE